MELVFLGTGAGMPSLRRNVTAIALNLLEEAGAYWLFDCGEGTQHQVLRSSVKLSRLEKLFVTHLHGDHIYGLPGLLTSRSYQGGETRLTLYGPKGIREFIESALHISQARLSYELAIEEIEEGVIVDEERFTVEARRVEHRLECFGFRISEKDQEGRLDAAGLKAIGVPSGPLYAELKRGHAVTLPDGRVINGADFVGPSIPGRIVTIVGDTLAVPASVELARDADLLVHEATFSHEKAEMAKQYFHATAHEAAEIAKEAGARELVLTHISSRYSEEEGTLLLKEAQAVFPATRIAEDFWSCTVPRRTPGG